jgi:hypothetical protein
MQSIRTNEKQAHPVASQIPNNLWSEVFNNQINEVPIKIVEKNFANIIRDDLPKGKIKALILLNIPYSAPGFLNKKA